MKTFLNNVFFCGSTFLFLNSEPCDAQPIQLIPQKEGSLEPLREFPPQEVMGFWEGTPSSVIETYFPHLPLRLTSPVLRAMRTELLKEKYASLLQNPSYEKALLSLLMETGQLEQGQELLLETNLSDKDSIFLDLQWLAGEHKKACEKIMNLIRTSPNLEWKKQNVYCLYLDGEGERAKIAAELLSETTSTASPLLNVLFDPVLQPPFEEAFANSPFLLTVWCATGQEIPEEALKKLSPSALALIARSEKMPLETRLQAAQMALQMGNFKGDDVLDLLKDASSEGLLKKFAHTLKSPKTETLLPLFEKAANEKKLNLVGDIFKSLLSKIKRSPATLSLAPYMIRVLLEAGEKDSAQKWGSFFMRESPDDAIATLPLLHVAFPQNKWGDVQLQAWQAYQSRVHPEVAAQNSYLLRHVLEALGEVQGPPMKGEPDAPSWRQTKVLFDEKALALLDSATDSQRKGEILLLTLIMIGESSLKDLSPDKLTPLLRALHKAGYTTEARALALEFLLAKGI